MSLSLESLQEYCTPYLFPVHFDNASRYSQFELLAKEKRYSNRNRNVPRTEVELA